MAKMTREEYERRKAALDADFEREEAQARLEVEIGQEGNYARVPYEKAKGWLQKTFGIDLDEEPVQDEPKAGDDKGDGKAASRFGRRVS